MNRTRSSELLTKLYTVTVTNNIAIVREEAAEIGRLFHLICRYWRLGRIWTKEEVSEIRDHVKTIAKGALTIGLVLLPGGFLLLPFTGASYRKKRGAA